MLDTREINHCQIPHVRAYMALEPNLAHMGLKHLRPHVEEGTPGGGPSLEAEEKRDQEHHGRFADSGEGKRA